MKAAIDSQTAVRSSASELSFKALLEKGVLHLGSASLLTYMLQFGSSLLVAGFLSPADLGEMRVLQAYILIFTLLANAGTSTALLKYASEPGDARYKSGLLAMAVRRASLTSVAAVGALAALTALGLTVRPGSYFHLCLYAISIPFSVLVEILTFYLNAARRFRALAGVQIVNRLLSLLFIAGGTKLWGLAGFLVSFSLAQVFGLISLARTARGVLTLVPPSKAPKGFTGIAIYSALSNGIALLGLNADLFVLYRFGVPLAVIGRYSFASLIVLGASVLTYTAMAVLTPYFSEHGRDPEWIRRQLILNQWRVTALSLITAAGGYLLASIVIRNMHGMPYAGSTVYLRVLLIKHILWSSQAVISVALLGMGLANYNFVVVLSATLVCVSVSCLAFEKWGVAGVAWGPVAGAAVALGVGLRLVSTALRRMKPDALNPCASLS